MSRYTKADLQNLLDSINAKMAKGSSQYRLEAESRNGYIAIDLYKNGACHSFIGGGTAQKCAAVVGHWVGANAISILVN